MLEMKKSSNHHFHSWRSNQGCLGDKSTLCCVTIKTDVYRKTVQEIYIPIFIPENTLTHGMQITSSGGNWYEMPNLFSGKNKKKYH